MNTPKSNCGKICGGFQRLNLALPFLLSLLAPSCAVKFYPISSRSTQQSATATAPSCSGTSVDSSIVSWWDGDSVSGTTALDKITGSSANDGTMSGSVTTTTGYAGTAFNLNGSTGSIDVPDASSLNPATELSISAWTYGNLNARSSNTTQTILSKWGFQSTMADPSLWNGVDISGASALNSANYRGFYHGVFDGRYVYFVPNANGGYVARYDTTGSLTSTSSWSGVDISGASALNSANYRGFSSALFDGRYIYFVPSANGGGNDGYVARYDTTGSLTSTSSWSGVDISGASALNDVNYKGFHGAVFDGRYIYFVPYSNGGGSDGYVARSDTTGSLTSTSSWSGVDISGASALNNSNYQGFQGVVFDGRYIYFVPTTNGSGDDGYVARYDTTGSLTSTSSWSGVDISGASALNSANYRGFQGAIFDGRYIYFVPLNNGVAFNGYVARYDTTGSLTSTSSWSGVDMSGASALNDTNYKGFQGAVFDGRYIYFVPEHNTTSFDGYVARYDTTGSLTSTSSWSGVDISGASALNSANYRGFQGAVFDGRYIYFVPVNNGATDGYVAQYDTTGSLASYSLDYSDSTRGDGFSASLPGTHFVVNTSNGPLSVASNSELTSGSWHNITGTYDGTNLDLYIDGVLSATQTGSGTLVNSTSDVTIGGLTGGQGYFNGLLDEVQIYNTSLSPAQVQSIYNAGTTEMCP